jgi:hypothetical protein
MFYEQRQGTITEVISATVALKAASSAMLELLVSS